MHGNFYNRVVSCNTAIMSHAARKYATVSA